MAVNISGVETNCEASKFSHSGDRIITDSVVVSKLPSQFHINEYRPTMFLKSAHNTVAEADVSSVIRSNDYEFGILGNTRIGANDDDTNAVGAMYFDNIDTEGITIPTPKLLKGSSPDDNKHEGRVFWEFLSKIWNFLKNDDRKEWENYWDALSACGFSIGNKATEFLNAIDPKRADVNVFEYYYDLEVGVDKSLPISLKPTLSNGAYVIKPLDIILNNPTVNENGDIVRRDMLSISPDDYYSIRDIGIGQNLILKDSSGKVESFKIRNLLSSEEPKDTYESAVYSGDPSRLYEGSRQIKITNTGTTSLADYKFLFILDEDGEEEDYGTAKAVKYSLDTDGINAFVITMQLTLDAAEPNIGEIATVVNALPEISSEGIVLTPIGESTGSISLHTPKAKLSRDSIKLKNMSMYTPGEVGNGRYIEPTSTVWRYYDGIDSSSDKTDQYGMYVPDNSGMRYIIELEGSLLDYDDEIVSFHLTTGLAYKIDSRVLSISGFSTTPNGAIVYRDGLDYVIHDDVIEFKNPILEGIETLYCTNATVINDSIFKTYGSMTGLDEWRVFHFNNTSAKAAINTLMKSMQSSGELQSYSAAMNVLYNLPVAPEDCNVYGLYESYGYEVYDIHLADNKVVITTDNNTPLHKFIQPGTTVLLSIGRNATVFDVDRVNRTITLDSVEGIAIGSKIFVGLQNKLRLKSSGVDTGDGKQYVTVACKNGAGAMQHVVDVYKKIYNGDKYPEITIYNAEDVNLNGVYHVVSAEDVPGAYGVVKLTVYSPNNKDLPKPSFGRYVYNDNIRTTNDSILNGFVHFPWPTHKFLLLWLKDTERYHTAYMDAPVDTIYDHGDTVDQYGILCRNVSVLNSESFPGWSKYSEFRFNNNIDEISSVVEVIGVIDGAEFGTYFPSEVH